VGANVNDQGPAAQAGPETRSEPTKPKFLVADDDPQVRALIAYVLRRDGADVVETGRGVELLEWAELAAWTSKRDVFDGIFSDIQMPDVTALDVLRKVPSIPRITPVVLVTAFGDEETRRTAYALGAEMVLSKPVNPDDLRALARSLAGRRGAR
jgi:CheY-like chemotaxis protein